jgi:hypothetical protein
MQTFVAIQVITLFTGMASAKMVVPDRCHSNAFQATTKPTVTSRAAALAAIPQTQD